MRVTYNTTAARANMKSKLIRKQIDRLEVELELHKASALKALDREDYEELLEVAAVGTRAQLELAGMWTQVNELRVIIDEGTTHISEEGDFA